MRAAIAARNTPFMGVTILFVRSGKRLFNAANDRPQCEIKSSARETVTGEETMSTRSLRCIAVLLGFATMIAGPVRAEDLKGEIAPTGKLRVAIAISTAGGAFWSNKTESGYAGVPVYLGKAMADELGVPVE